jgi:hypothetical protein
MIYSKSIYTEMSFFVPPKCGWTSFLKLYQNQHSKNGIEFYHQIKNKLSVDVFVIRNPIDRFISAYKNKVLCDTPIKDKLQRKIKEVSLDSIIENLNIVSSLDVHFYPLSLFYNICSKKPKYILDIQNDTKEIKKLFGYDIPKENSTKNINISLNQKQVQKIYTIYQKDFELFNYETNIS